MVCKCVGCVLCVCALPSQVVKPAEPEWTELGDRMLQCVTCNMAWMKKCESSCKCKKGNFDFKKLCMNPEPEKPEKFEIEIDMSVTPQKDKLAATVTTRAGFTEPHKFKPIKLLLDPDCTIAGLRRQASLEIHGKHNMDLDPLMTCPLKDANGVVLNSEMDNMTIKTWLNITKSDQLKLNMCVDAYGEGGGKRVVASIAFKKNLVISILILISILNLISILKLID